MCWDERIIKAIDDIFKSQDKKVIKQGVNELLKVKQSEGKWSGDASYILAVVYSKNGMEYRYSGIKADNEKAQKYLKESIEANSPLGVIGALNMKLISLKEIKETMKYDSLKDAYVDLMNYANRGISFCQYMVAEVYYHKNIFVIENLRKKDINVDIQREMKKMCAYWYEKAMEDGLYLGFFNYAHMYIECDAVIEQDESSLRKILERVSNTGYLEGELSYAKYLIKKAEYEKSFSLLEKTANCGYYHAFYYMAQLVDMGVIKNDRIKKAIDYYKYGAIKGDTDCMKEYAIYLFKEKKDYETAFDLFEDLSANDVEIANMYLGIMHLEGLCVNKNFALARGYFEKSIKYTISKLGLGIIYANGYGVNINLEKAVEYFMRCEKEGSKDAKALLKNYKCVNGEWIKKKISFARKSEWQIICNYI